MQIVIGEKAYLAKIQSQVNELYWSGCVNNEIYLRANITIHCMVGYFSKFNNKVKHYLDLSDFFDHEKFQDSLQNNLNILI